MAQGLNQGEIDRLIMEVTGASTTGISAEEANNAVKAANMILIQAAVLANWREGYCSVQWNTDTQELEWKITAAGNETLNARDKIVDGNRRLRT